MPAADSTVLVTATGDRSYRVEVGSGPRTSTHQVEVPDGYEAELGLATVPGAELVRASFEFLLEREPASSILRRFGLDVIERYFPEYRAEIAGYVT
jgi:hypothetical protein